MRAFTLIFAILASAYGILLAYLLINNPFHGLPFQPFPPSPPLPQPYAVVKELCLDNYYPLKPENCFVKLMQIPSNKYATDSKQIIRILVDQIYRSSLTARHILTFQHTHLSSDSIKGLQQCQNGKLFPEIPLGSVDQFWRQVLSHVGICFHQNDRADNVVKEFIIHSVFDEIDDLVRVGYAFKHKVQNFRSIRLTELKPTPLVVHHRLEWCPDPKRFRE